MLLLLCLFRLKVPFGEGGSVGSTVLPTAVTRLEVFDDVGVEAVQTRALTFRESFAVLSAAVVPSTL